MFRKRPTRSLAALFALGLVSLLSAPPLRSQNGVMAELLFSAATHAERLAGVWIDGLYVGYLDELKGTKTIMLLAGEHDVAVRRAGYKDFKMHFVVEPGIRYRLTVAMEEDPQVEYPGPDAAILKLDIKPARAAVFLNDGYVGHAGAFGGAFHAMAVNPGTHRIKIELPGYQTFETEIKLLPGQESEIKTELLKGTIQQASELVREP